MPFWVLRHSFLSLTCCLWLYNIRLKTSRGVLFLPPSDAYVRSFLYLLYNLIKLYYTKALSDQASSLASDWILLHRGPRIPMNLCDSTITFHFQWKAGLLYFRMDWLDLSQSKGLQESSPTPQFKSINYWCAAFFMVQPSHLYMTTGKTRALTRWNLLTK